MSAAQLLAPQLAPQLAEPRTLPLAAFGNDPFWITIIKAIVIFGFLVVLTLLTIWGERRVVARMQMRVGPNRVGPAGVLQGLADGLKLAFKEDIIPVVADRPVFLLAPIVSAIPAFLAFAVIPFGGTVSIAGHQTALQLTDLPMAVLFILAMSSLGVYGIVLAGWSSGSPYPLLGGLRSAAQMISYEVAMGLALVAVFLYAGTLSTSGIVAAQHGQWYVWVLPVSFLVYAISAVGETNRAPFDLPEAEGELVGGFHTEYSSLKFAMFFLAEYINMVTVSAVAVTLFFGGWRPCWPFSLVSWMNNGWFGLVWFVIKILICLFVFIWLRGTLPRLRYDQFMRFGWKALVPISLVWIVLVAVVRNVSLHTTDRNHLLLYGGGPVLLVIFAVAFWPAKQAIAEDETARQQAQARGSGDFPVPDLPEPPRKPGGPILAGPPAEAVKEVTRA